MNPVKVTSSADQPPRLQIAGVPEDEALANLHASHAPVARGPSHFCKQNLLIVVQLLR
jgi:hypothetical protein